MNRKNDGTFVGMSEIIGTPVFFRNRIYLAIGRDPAHGRGRGALHCIDATKTGDITKTGKIWSYQGLDRTLSTASIADGLLYLSDVAGRLHCLDAETGHCHWVYETNSEVWGSTLVADGKVFMPTHKGLCVLAAGKEEKVLSRINVGGAHLRIADSCQRDAVPRIQGRLDVGGAAGIMCLDSIVPPGREEANRPRSYHLYE